MGIIPTFLKCRGVMGIVSFENMSEHGKLPLH